MNDDEGRKGCSIFSVAPGKMFLFARPGPPHEELLGVALPLLLVAAHCVTHAKRPLMILSREYMSHRDTGMGEEEKGSFTSTCYPKVVFFFPPFFFAGLASGESGIRLNHGRGRLLESCPALSTRTRVPASIQPPAASEAVYSRRLHAGVNVDLYLGPSRRRWEKSIQIVRRRM